MKKLIIAVVAIAALAGCDARYADELAALDAEVAELNARLDEMCSRINSDIKALQDIVEAVQTNDYITGVQPLEENGIVTGYVISFYQRDDVVIRNGKDGTDGVDGEDGYIGKSPVVGVRQDPGGNWYWTVDGEWMRDTEGNRVRANAVDGIDGAEGQGGIVPMFKVEDGCWYLSLDGGLTYTLYGAAVGDAGAPGTDGVVLESIFSEILWDDGYVYLHLEDGTVITLPVKKQFAISLTLTSDIPVSPGTELSIAYSVSGAQDGTLVTCLAEGEWRAEVVKEDFFSGYVLVNVPDPFSEGKVLVIASNPDGSTVMQTLTFQEIVSEQ